MYKIRFQQNKDTLIGVGAFVLIVLVAIVNVVSALPILWQIYRPDGSHINDKTIDEEKVNEAIQIIKQTPLTDH